MHKCEFCHTEFSSRPQVKNPRACPACQGLRQRNNEYDWRKRNPTYSSAAYHELRRSQRQAKLNGIAQALVKCIKLGKALMGMDLKMEELSLALAEFLSMHGIRRVNKFWNSNLAM
jgi:hypothetical protein